MPRRDCTCILLILLLLALAAAPIARADDSDSAMLKSPNGDLAIQFEIMAPPAVSFDGKPIDRTKRLVYSVTFHDKPIVQQSALRLELADKGAIGPNLKIVSQKP